MSFVFGVAEALGFKTLPYCAEEVKNSFPSFLAAWKDYKAYKAGKADAYMMKSLAMVKFAEGAATILAGLTCMKSIKPGPKYAALIKNLYDPRFYSLHNALTLIFNAAEDRGQLVALYEAMLKGNFFEAGEEIARTMLDVLGDPGIPSVNGTKATEISAGLAEGGLVPTSGTDPKCFHDVSVVVPAVVGGWLDICAGRMQGYESLTHGLRGLEPCFPAFKNPVALAELWAQHIKDHGLDIALESASAVLAYSGEEWRHFGRELGKILVNFPLTPSTAVVV